MGFDYHVDGTQRLVQARAHGCIGLLDICVHLDRVRQDARFGAGMRSLTDLTGAAIDVSVDEVWRIAEYIKPLARVAAQACWAVVAPDDAAFVNFRIFESVVRPFGIDARIFRSREEALEWLAEQPAAQGQASPPLDRGARPLFAAG
jgi:hypothetical protein